MTDVDVLKILKDHKGSEGSLVITIKLNNLAELEALLLARMSAKESASPQTNTLVETPPILKEGQGNERPIPLKEALEFTNLTRQGFYNARRRGEVETFKLGGKLYFFKSQLLAALKKC
jgi:hypothetical protein